jgi:hypothetical protein
VLLALDVEFRPDLPSGAIAPAVRRIEQAIRARYPKIQRIYIDAIPLRGPAASAGRAE